MNLKKEIGDKYKKSNADNYDMSIYDNSEDDKEDEKKQLPSSCCPEDRITDGQCTEEIAYNMVSAITVDVRRRCNGRCTNIVRRTTLVVQSTMYTVPRTVYVVRRTVYGVHCTMVC